MKAATPKPQTCAGDCTNCGGAAQGDESSIHSLKDALARFQPSNIDTSDTDNLHSSMWFNTYIRNEAGYLSAEVNPQSHALLEMVELALNQQPYNVVDAKCLEVEMNSTELLATPSACVRKRTIKIAMDSGAGDHVASPEDVEGFAIEESPNSKAGRNFVAANGGKIRNHGQSMVKMRTKDGMRVASTFQVADVTRPLYSVSKLCDAGYDVPFKKDEALVTKDGKIIHRFHSEGGLYVAEMHIGDDGQDPSFGGQGAKR